MDGPKVVAEKRDVNIPCNFKQHMEIIKKERKKLCTVWTINDVKAMMVTVRAPL